MEKNIITLSGKKPYLDLYRDFDQIYVLYFSRMRRFAEEYILSKEDAETAFRVFHQIHKNLEKNKE